MPNYTCACGAKYKIPDSSIGRKAKCKKCGEVFTVRDDDAPIALAEESFESPEDSGVAAVAGRRAPDALVLPSPGGAASVRLSEPIAARRASGRTYLDSVLWTFLFVADPRNLISFIVLWFAIFMAGAFVALPIGFGRLSIMFFLVIAVLYGWYCSLLFHIVEGAAAGEEHLPEVDFSDWVDEIFMPAAAYMGTWIVVLTPAFLAVLGGAGGSDAMTVARTMAAGFTDPISTFRDAPDFAIALYGGLFLWPMVILVVTLGGFSCVWRFDLMFRTLARTPGQYALTVLLVLAATVADAILSNALNTAATNRQAAGGGFMATTFVAQFLGAGVSLYFDIVALRAIGLYFFHFKDKFAWNFGQ